MSNVRLNHHHSTHRTEPPRLSIDSLDYEGLRMLREGDSGALHKGIASYWCETLRHIQFFSGISREKAAEFFRISVNMVEAIRGLSPCDLTMAALRLSQMPVCRVPPFSERGERMVLEILRDADVTKLTPEQALAEIAHGMQQPDD